MRLIAMKGMPGCGKSAVSRALSKQLGCPVIDKDDIKDVLDGHTSEAGPLAYETMFNVARRQLTQGLNVICDSPLTFRRSYEKAQSIALETHATLVIVECLCSDRTANQLHHWKNCNMMTTFHHTAAIILAAGSSSRMGGGRHKLLLPLHGRPVLAHVLDAVLASQARPVVLVLGHQPDQVRNHLAEFTSLPDLNIVENPDYLQGMSTSMRLGIQTLQVYGYTKHTNTSIDSTLVLLGDQPLITAQHIDALIATYRTTGKRIIAPTYEGKRGNPILFDASLFPELLEVTGDEGGRSVLERHRDELATVEMGNPLANIDVDTWDAYQRVVEIWEQK